MKKTYCNITDCTNRKTLMQDANGGEYSRNLCCNQQCTHAKEQDGEYDLRISVAKLREVLANKVPPYSEPNAVIALVDDIIETVKSEL